jgi:hypothetical protein
MPLMRDVYNANGLARCKHDYCYPIRLWPCDHIVGDQCLKLWMSNSVDSEAGLCPYCRQPLMVASEPQSMLQKAQKKVKRYLSSSQMSAVPDIVVNDVHDLQVQLTTQHLNALQMQKLPGPLQDLALMLCWSCHTFGGPLATIFSGLPVVDKVGAVLTILAQPVITILAIDALSHFLQGVIHGLDYCLGR